MDTTSLVAGAAAVAVLAGGAVLLRGRSKPPAPALKAATRRPAVAPDTGALAAQPEAPAPAPARLPAALADFRLLEEQDLSAESRAQLAERLSKVALPPRGLQQFLAADIGSPTAARELAEFVLGEPRLAARVLARANSPFYGLQSPIASVPHAITYLGLNAVRSMALGFMLTESVSVDDPALRRYCDRVWEAGMVASELCSLLGTKLNFTDTGAVCTQTVLSFLGELAVPALGTGDEALAWDVPLIERLRREQQTFGASSVLLGSIVMHAWGLPESIVAAVTAACRVAVTPVAAADPAAAPRSALAYACARMGEAIAQRRIDAPEQLWLAGSDAPELHHLQAYLALPALARLPELLQAPDVRLALMRMIAAEQGTRAPG